MSNLSGEVKICGSSIGEGTIATTNADGSMRDLSAILADCRTAFGGLSESEKAAAAEALVGKNAMSGFLALMNAAPADIEKVSSAIANCDGKSAEMAATMQDNLALSVNLRLQFCGHFFCFCRQAFPQEHGLAVGKAKQVGEHPKPGSIAQVLCAFCPLT